jgi:hypothetical protein
VSVPGYRPRNRYVQRPLDLGLWPWLKRCSLGALALAVTLGALVGPRQTTVRTRYQIAQLNLEVARLESEYRSLLLQRERLSSPAVLASQIETMGLVRVSPAQVAFLEPTGRLRYPAPRPTPRPTRPPASPRSSP